jgi:hypothetical protein
VFTVSMVTCGPVIRTEPLPVFAPLMLEPPQFAEL